MRERESGESVCECGRNTRESEREREKRGVRRRRPLRASRQSTPSRAVSTSTPTGDRTTAPNRGKKTTSRRSPALIAVDAGEGCFLLVSLSQQEPIAALPSSRVFEVGVLVSRANGNMGVVYPSLP